MKLKFSYHHVLFYGLALFMLVISAVSLVTAVTWINRPFPGFLIFDFPYIGSMGSRDWPGIASGLKTMERVKAVEGVPVKEGREVLSLVEGLEPGDPVTYTIQSGGGTREVTVPLHTFGLKDFLLVFLIPFLGGFALYALGVIAYLMKPNTKSSWVFLVLCFSLGTYMVTGFEMQSSYIFVHLHYVIISLFPATFFHLGLIFPERKPIPRLPVLEVLIYMIAAVLTGAYQAYLFSFPDILDAGSGLIPQYGKIALVNRFFTLFCVAALFALMIHSSFRGSTTVARQRARMILFGVTVAFVPSVIISLLVFLFRLNFPYNFLVFFVVFFPASIAYSIVRHNLFDADEIIKRTVGYFVVTGLIVGAYAGISLAMNVYFGTYQLAHSRAFPVIFALGTILVFNPLRDRIQRLVDRLFFRREYNYGEVVEKVGNAMNSLLDLGQIMQRLIRTFIDDVFINTSSVMLLTPAGTEYRVCLAGGDHRDDVEDRFLDRNEDLIKILEEEKHYLTKYDVMEDPRFRAASEQCVRQFEGLHASLVVPLVYQGKVMGLLNLGEKKSGKSYNREDIELLRTLANQGAMAIENARLFNENLEKQRMEEELAIARDLQMSMLPARCPEVKGFGLAAVSFPAKEVGGDFYDFIELDEGRFGLIIGDVTGKSVSGALVMSAARSVFRMLSEEETSVGRIMTRANQRTFKDIKSGMFVALLYAVLDANSHTLSMCSAGQTQPILFSAETRESRLLETEGDTFPLGILQDSGYLETDLSFAPGDKLVFYTDGIVEAMNPDSEIFGFERLLEVVRGAGSMDADSLLSEILEQVRVFVAGAPQHDDLTVIVVAVEG